MRNGIATCYLQQAIFVWLADCSLHFKDVFVPLVSILESCTRVDRYKFEMGGLHMGFGIRNSRAYWTYMLNPNCCVKCNKINFFLSFTALIDNMMVFCISISTLQWLRHAVAHLVEALSYKSEGRGFEQFVLSSGSGRLLPLRSATSLTYASGDLCTYYLLNINNAGCLQRHARWVKDETHCYVASSRPALDWLPLIFTSGFTRN
jgi:hypothetical protein